MLLVFISPPAKRRRIGPLPGFRVERECLLEHPSGSVIAALESNVWRLDGEAFPRLECEGRLTVRFQRNGDAGMSRTFGPYPGLSILDGVAYVGERIFASLDRRGSWFSHEGGSHWPVMLVESLG